MTDYTLMWELSIGFLGLATSLGGLLAWGMKRWMDNVERGQYALKADLAAGFTRLEDELKKVNGRWDQIELSLHQHQDALNRVVTRINSVEMECRELATRVLAMEKRLGLHNITR